MLIIFWSKFHLHCFERHSTAVPASPDDALSMVDLRDGAVLPIESHHLTVVEPEAGPSGMGTVLYTTDVIVLIVGAEGMSSMRKKRITSCTVITVEGS